MSTARNQLLERFPFARNAHDSNEELASALYSLLRTSDIAVTVDGWGFFGTVRESPQEVEAVGLMSLLPTGEVPIEVRVEATSAGLAFEARVGRDDDAWRALSDSKRWRLLYQYVHGDGPLGWDWDTSFRGVLDV
jgi:hypothetical protein